jgi:hypothetical protein
MLLMEDLLYKCATQRCEIEMLRLITKKIKIKNKNKRDDGNREG